MDKRLNRLLRSHEFFQRTLDENGAELGLGKQDELRQAADKAFSELVHYASPDPRVTLAQIELLMSGLPLHPSDSAEAEALREKCLDAIRRLAAEAIRLAGLANGDEATDLQ